MSATQTKINILTDKIKELNDKRDALLAQLAHEQALQNVGVGDVVSLRTGRGKTRRVEVGKVIVVYEDANGGKRVKVLVGAGAITELYDIAVSQIVSVQEPPKEAAA